MEYKAICTDIDGTLLDANRELSQKTISAIKGLEQRVPVILASSRMPSAMRHLQAELDILDHPLICFNGGYVIQYVLDAEAPEVLLDIQIPLPVCTSIVEAAKGTDIHISLYHADLWFAPQQDEWTVREIRNTKVQPTIASNLEVLESWSVTNSGAHKVMCMGPEKEIAALADQLEAELGEHIYVYKSKSTYLELAPRSISKATALEVLLKEKFDFGLSKVVAFGDNYNDIELLKAVGLGIAVGSARPEVKKAAKEVTADSTKDGVALSIEKHFTLV